MKKKTLLTARNYISLFFLSISLILVFKILFNMIAMGFIENIWGLPSLEIYNDLQNQDFKYLYAHKVLAFCDQLGTFLIPSFLFFIIIKSITVNLSFEIKKDMVKMLLYFLILLGLAQLFLLISLKIGYDFLPASAQDFLKNQQEFNTKLQEGFITNTLSGFLFNLLLLAFIPAIGEELFFRGILQNICVGLFRNRIVGVLITSLIFGLLHFQIENLLSIIFASILLGLVYEYSNNILITIILHFGFNSFSLCCMQALKSGYLNENQLDLMGNYLFIPLGVTISVYVIIKKVFWEEELLLSID